MGIFKYKKNNLPSGSQNFRQARADTANPNKIYMKPKSADSLGLVYVVAKDSWLLRWVRAADTERRLELVRFGQLKNACEKGRVNLRANILVDWLSDEAASGIEELGSLGKLCGIRSRIFVCVRDMPKLFVSDAESIRFAILQTGVCGVFSQFNELVSLIPAFVRYSAQFKNTNKQDIFSKAWDSLPWKNCSTDNAHNPAED
jgi:hypothetical protein